MGPTRQGTRAEAATPRPRRHVHFLETFQADHIFALAILHTDGQFVAYTFKKIPIL